MNTALGLVVQLHSVWTHAVLALPYVGCINAVSLMRATLAARFLNCCAVCQWRILWCSEVA